VGVPCKLSITALLIKQSLTSRRHFHPASQYTSDVYQYPGMARKELAKISGGNQLLRHIDGGDPIILARWVDDVPFKQFHSNYSRMSHDLT
jgi:hypothetical protein